MTDDDRPWTPDEAAAWFSVSVVTVRRWVREGRLDRIGTGALRITARSVRALSLGGVDNAARGRARDGDDRPDEDAARAAEAPRGRDDGGRQARVADRQDARAARPPIS